MKRKETLRIVFPQWQGGVNPNYAFGAELLSHIVPPSKCAETVTIPVGKNFPAALTAVDGVDAGDVLGSQMVTVERVLAEKQPAKLIVMGGDCSISQIPFAYLRSRYGDKLGILWLDAHPDVADTNESSHLHEMVLGNLLGQNPSSALTSVINPFPPNLVMLAGLIEEDLRAMDQACVRLHLAMAAPAELKESSQIVLNWLEANDIDYVAVHWDLDVLSPGDFRSILPAKPYDDPADFPAAVGRMTLSEISRLLNDVSEKAEIVGLSIAEHMPWDAINLRNALGELAIFKEE